MTQAVLTNHNTPALPDARTTFIGLVALVFITLIAYMGVAFNDYITLDDPGYVYQNPMVQKGLTPETAVWAFTSVNVSNWHPVTMLSHLLDVTLFGIENPGAQHGVSLLIHTLNACLLFWLLCKTTGMPGRAWVVAALFAVHPIHVESVAWISSRKDVLSLFFVLISMLAYVRWLDRGRKPVDYLLILLAYAMALMSKPTAVTLPALLLLLDLWPLNRFTSFKDLGKLTLEKIPLMFLAGIMSLVTYLTQQATHAMAGQEKLPIDARLANIPVSYVRYLRKLVYPEDLAVLYPHPASWTMLGVGVSVFVLLSLTKIVASEAAQERKKYSITGWLWFLGALIPMIGLVQVGSQSMADRYAYISFIGLYIMLVWMMANTLDQIRLDIRLRVVLCIGILACLVMVTRTQVGYWAGPESLYTRGIAVTKDNFFLLNNLGEVQLSLGRPREAKANLEEAVRLHPGLVQAHENLGLALMALDEPVAAAKEYQQALDLGSIRQSARLNLGWALLESGRPQDALEAFKALGTAPDALTGVAASLARLGKGAEARVVFEQVRAQAPGYTGVVYHQARMLLDEGDAAGAAAMLLPIIQSEPGNAPAMLLMAKALAKKGDTASAQRVLEEARLRFPDNVRVEKAITENKKQ